MRNTAKNWLGLILISLLWVSCGSDDGTAIITPIPFEITVTLDKDFDNIALEKVAVKLVNRQTSVVYEAISDEMGKAAFDAVIPGSYNITAEYSLTKAEYEVLFKVTVDQEITNFNGSQDNVAINNASGNSQTLVLETSKIGDLLFKQIYYVGSHIADGAGSRDMFVEIYNNSNEIIYADGLYFAQIYGSESNGVAPFTLANGQYDWSQSLNQTKGNTSNTDYIYADNIFQIPGTGQQYPINAGESIIIASTAINHKTPLVTEKETFSINDPSLTVDLSIADFEAFLAPIREANEQFPLRSDIDNPAVPDLNVLRFVGKEMIFDPSGEDSFVIFRTDNIDSLDELPRPDVTIINSSTRLYLQIPNDAIIDAVETNNSNVAELYPRRLPNALDGGFMSVPKGGFSSQAIIRKVANTFGDRRVLQDTNNSSNDFEVIDRPLPKGWK